MPNKIVKNKKQYMLGKQGSLNSQAGDEAWADAFSTAVTGLDTSWSTPIDLSTTTPTGLTTATINSEVRITQVDLRSQVTGMGKLTGSIDIPEWGNLKQCTLIATYHNDFTTDYPNAIHKIGASLKHWYPCVAQSGSDVANNFPHELYRSGRGTYDQPKNKGTEEENVIKGTINSDIDNLTNLENFYLNFCDDWTGNVGNNNSPNTVNGVQNFPNNIWNIDTLVGISFLDNWNVAGSGNTSSFPADMSNLTNLEIIQIGGGSGSAWDASSQGFMTGSHLQETLPSLREYSANGNASLTNFVDFSGSPDMVLIGMKGSNFSGSFPSWIVDGTIESGGGNAWQHFDSLVLAGPEGWQYNGSDFDVTPAGLSGSIPEPSGGVQILYVDNFDVKLNDIQGAIPDSFWDNNITKITFDYTNITSLGSDPKTLMLGMTQTTVWFFKYAQIGPEPLPNLDWSVKETNSINWAWFQGNRYVFSDLLYVPSNAPAGETCLDLWIDRTSNTFIYAPQREFGTPNTYSSTDGNGDIVINDFDGVVSHVDNSYQWQKDGSNISGATSVTHTISNATSSDNGTYTLVVTNLGAPDLTLTSENITVNL